jgi:hypothetical protein
MKKKVKSGRTPPSVAKVAGTFLQMDDQEFANWYSTARMATIKEVILRLAANAVSQAKKKAVSQAKNKKEPRERYDDWGFDPRDGGKIGRARGR